VAESAVAKATGLDRQTLSFARNNPDIVSQVQRGEFNVQSTLDDVTNTIKRAGDEL